MEMDLLFPTPKLHYCHTRRSRFQCISTTYDLRLVNIKSSSRLEKDITFISRPHLAISLPLKSSLTKHTEILAQRLTLATAFWDIDKS